MPIGVGVAVSPVFLPLNVGGGSASAPALLLESGSYILLESGDKLLLE